MARKPAADSLTEYRRKRDFAKTAEPAGKRRAQEGPQLRRPEARRRRGSTTISAWSSTACLKSWAVTRGPEPQPFRKAARRRRSRTIRSNMAASKARSRRANMAAAPSCCGIAATWEPLHDPADGLKRRHAAFQPARRAAEGRLGAGPHAAARQREAQQLAAHQGARRIRRRCRSAPRNQHDQRRKRPLDGGDRRRRFRGLALQPRRAAAAPKSTARTRRKKARSLSLPAFRPPQLATARGPRRPPGEDWVHEFKYRRLPLRSSPRTAPTCAATRAADRTGPTKFRPIADAIAVMDLAGVADRRRDRLLRAGRPHRFLHAAEGAFGGRARSISSPSTCSRRTARTSPSRPLVERKNRLQALFDDLPKGSSHPFQHACQRRRQMRCSSRSARPATRGSSPRKPPRLIAAAAPRPG